jgi:hypothetical protein
MPDWTYQTLFRPLLFCLPAARSRAHPRRTSAPWREPPWATADRPDGPHPSQGRLSD